MSETVAPGTQRATALKKQTSLTVESPTIGVVGGKKEGEDKASEDS